ncbi:MAG: hypothetical protein IPI04_12805 [Ignavibacteria bacterium]|nr:hypothetical protein [Ignavibacteria bacterium]
MYQQPEDEKQDYILGLPFAFFGKYEGFAEVSSYNTAGNRTYGIVRSLVKSVSVNKYSEYSLKINIPENFFAKGLLILEFRQVNNLEQ